MLDEPLRLMFEMSNTQASIWKTLL